jgi:HSP20 family molecular chaperone IbpA
MTARVFESGDTMVVTLRVPTARADDLAVTAVGRLVRVIGPGDYRHEVKMEDADLEALHAQLFRGILELRAPRCVEPTPPQVAHVVPVETLS